MKVGLWVHCFYPDHFYGTETYTKQVAKNLQSMGDDVTVVAAVFQGEPVRPEFVSRYEYDGISVISLDKNHVPHMRVTETYWQEAMRSHLKHLLEHEAFDIVHVTHLVNHTAVLLEEVKRLNTPLVATLTDFFGFCHNCKLEAHDGSLCTGPDPLRINCIACYKKQAGVTVSESRSPLGLPSSTHLRLGALDERAAFATSPWTPAHDIVGDLIERPDILRRAYRLYDAMIAPTSFLKQAYVANGFERDKMVLSRFGVDLDRSPKPPRGPDHRLTVGFIGQIAPHKGVHLLISAVRALEPANQVRLLVYGSSSSAEYLHDLKQVAGPETEFRGTFPSDKIAGVLAEMDLLAIPSTWYENSPLVLLNALASHTPVLVSDVDGLTEFIEEDVSGWRFRRGDLGDLTRVLRNLVTEPSRVYEATSTTEYVRDTKIMTQEITSIYEKLLSTPVSPQLEAAL